MWIISFTHDVDVADVDAVDASEQHQLDVIKDEWLS